MSSEPRQRQRQRIDPELAKARSRVALAVRWHKHGATSDEELQEAYELLAVAQRNAKIRKAQQLLQEAGVV